MPYIKVNTNKISRYSNDINSVYTRVNRIKSEFASIGYSLDWDIKSASGINNRIKNVENELSAQYSGLKRIQSFLNNTVSKYNNVENTINNDKKTREIQSAVRSVSTANISNDAGDKIRGFLIKNAEILIENAGWGGGFISAISKLINSSISGPIDPGGIAKGSKKVVSSIYNAIKNSEKLEKLSRMNPGQAVKTGVKRFVGFDKAFTGSLRPSVAKSFNTRFYNNFQKQLDDGLSSFTAKGSKSIFAWAGVAVSAIANGFQNYDEYKSGKISGGRAVAETITETAVDVGTGLLVSAAIGAGIAAVGFTSAPVIAVGAITAGVMVSTDAICKWITKSVTGESKGLTETISDFILDVGEARIKSRVKFISGAVKAAGNAGKAVNSFFKKLF